MEEKMDINTPIPFDADPEQDKPRVFTVPDGQYALTAWALELKRSKNGDPLMNVQFGINGEKGSKWLYHYITLLPKASKGHGMTIHALKCLGFAIDKGIVNFKPADIICKVCRAELVTEKFESTSQIGKVTEKSKNVIKSMLYPTTEDLPEMPIAKEEPAF